MGPDPKERLRTDRDLRELAATPLLCAMLCAMNRDKKQVLPTNRIALYDAAVQMILHGRDEERLIRLDDLPRLEYETKRALIQEIAYWMMQNGESMAEASRVESFIAKKLPMYTRLQEGLEPVAVLAALVLRSGIIRSPIDGKIDFIHNAFKEFLCARAVVSGDHFGFVKGALSNEAWREVAALATAMADSGTRARFINDLLATGDKNSGARARYHLLAVRCLETCVELSEELQREIKDRLKGLSPPSNISEARALSAAGEMALPLLKFHPNYYAKTAAACVRGLRMVGTVSALHEIEKFAPDDRSTVAKEISAAWPYFDTEEYAKVVLSEFVGIYGSIQLFFPEQFKTIKYLKKVRSIFLQGRRDSINQSVLEEVSNLDQLSYVSIYSSSPIDVGIFSKMPILQTLTLNCPEVRSLSKVVDLDTLTALEIMGSHVQKVDLSHLPASLAELLIRSADLELHQSAKSPTNLVNINLSKLLSLDQIDLFGDSSELRSISIEASSSSKGLEVLSRFEGLTKLYLSDVQGLECFSGLDKCTELRSITLKDCATLKSISGLVHTDRLVSFDIKDSRRLEDPSELRNLKSVQDLSLSLDDSDDPSFLFEMPNLRYLHVIGLSMETAKGLDHEIRARNPKKHFRMRWQIGKSPPTLIMPASPVPR